MASVTISKIKPSFSELQLKVKVREELFITERGKTLAKIVTVKRDDLEIPPHLFQLEKAGLLRLGKKKLPDNFWNQPRPSIKYKKFSGRMK